MDIICRQILWCLLIYLKVSFFPFRMKEGLDGISFIGKGKVAEVIQKMIQVPFIKMTGVSAIWWLHASYTSLPL